MNVPRSAISRAAPSHPPHAARERAADADAAHAERRRLLDGDERRIHEQVHGLRRDGRDDRRDLVARGDAWRIEAVGACAGVRDEPTDRVVEIGMPDDVPLGSRGQQRPGPAALDRRSSRGDALDGECVLVERVLGIAGRVLDRQARDAGRGGQLHVRGDDLGIVGEAALEVGVERHGDG
ncbi:hypothetical protein [Agrococcus sp. Marseille-Q4369]|uniref:hypothetical protein n=1 Tax=Agrococcus sp. Marseille-Q4369 TaxID=2810513 RepID=UPI001B8D34DE|nr:hypothetical protein [Agrococcus sp. Marseille-Q4369]QUW20249.1 hypothetical protein JSQ78_03630 [Agrococcus sp. Marseille-Q4369]